MTADMQMRGQILIVDDSPTNLKILSRDLQAYGFKIFVAQSGEGALQQLDYILPDLILLDVIMPGIDGFKTCARIKQREATRDIPVIFMTGLADVVDKVRGFKAGGVDYITRPYQFEEVLARITTQVTLRQQQKRLAAQYRQLQELKESRDRLLKILPHDLKNPFTVIFTSAEVLNEYLDTLDEKSLRERVSSLYLSATRITRLIEKLLDWIQLQEGSYKIEKKAFMVSELISETIDLFRLNVEPRRITLDFEQLANPTVYADRNMIESVIRNLVGNSIKFTANGGQIQVSTSIENEFAIIQVRDNGIGMDKKVMANLFRIDMERESYRQEGVDGETGTGLGLVLCKEMIEENGGTIWVESKKNVGSTFSFSIPLHQPAA